MDIIHSLLLGLIQGITEFLPISSSGHLIIARQFLGISLDNTLAFDVSLHIATLFAILFCFKNDISRIYNDFKTEGLSKRSSNLLLAIVFGSIPAGLIGFFYGEIIESTFRDPKYVVYTLLLGSLLFWIADKFSKNNGGLSIFKGFIIGIFQSLALFSGFSRSGSTISGGLLVGLSRQESIKFSFLLGIPIIAGAGLKTFFDMYNAGYNLSPFLSTELILGFIVALISGIYTVKFLVKYLSNNSFTVFIIYRVVLAVFIFLTI